MNRKYLKYIKPGDEVFWKDKIQELTGRHTVKEIYYVEYLERVVVVTSEDIRLEGRMSSLHLGSEAALEALLIRKEEEDVRREHELQEREEQVRHERALIKAETQEEKERLRKLKVSYDQRIREFDRAEAKQRVQAQLAEERRRVQEAKEKAAREAAEHVRALRREKLKTTYDVKGALEILGEGEGAVYFLRGAEMDTYRHGTKGTCKGCGAEGYLITWKQELYCRDCLCADDPEMEKQQLLSSNFGQTVNFDVSHAGHGHFYGVNSSWLFDSYAWAENILHSLPYRFSPKVFYTLREELVKWSRIHGKNEWHNARSMLLVRFQSEQVEGVREKKKARFRPY